MSGTAAGKAMRRISMPGEAAETGSASDMNRVHVATCRTDPAWMH